MAAITYFVALPFLRADDGTLMPEQAVEPLDLSKTKRCASHIATTAIALCLSVLVATAQQAPPQEVAVSDLIQGYVPLGTVVIASGHLAYVNGQVLLNPSMPSAMSPVILNVTRLPVVSLDWVQTRCAAPSINAGGCSARVHGQVQRINARPSLLATEIELLR